MTGQQAIDAAKEPAEGETRRDFIHIAAGAAAVGGGVMLAWPFIAQMNPAADTLAQGTIDVDLTKVAPGQQVSLKFRGKPLFVRNRTPAEIARARADDDANLKDPQPDSARVVEGQAQWLILIGSCTHLGCVPTFGGGDYGGWFCPCHGSHYDVSGRIRKGPAPTNLEVPPVTFLSPTSARVGQA
ncbi:MAG: ubiquinol-cytochrome c reductase iron-sulfur subunit [Proteobacteria bacterium]|nr:ubiquinol-cytochrome c reductase iron-sulfur subunit [Pseudomonadota bacterium]